VIRYRWALPLLKLYEEPVATNKILFVGLRHLFSFTILDYILEIRRSVKAIITA
jgi:hypothetical protein